jgi:ATP-dependent helicase/nuclease subunit A
MIITDSQREAIKASGNVLVLAGAGSGKTSTLVERCLHYLLHPQHPVSVEEMLIVTFTDAAAAEVRKRLRERLERARGNAEAAIALRLERETALLESAPISTLHSFCLRLVREHFEVLGLDPSVAVFREEQAAMFMEAALDVIMEKHFQAATKDAERVQELVEAYAGRDEGRIRAVVVKLHNYAQTLANPAEWFAQQIAPLQEGTPRLWREWLKEALIGWCGKWGPVLERLSENRFATQFCARVQAARAANPKEFGALLKDVSRAIDPVPHGLAGDRDVIQDFFDEAAFLESLLGTSAASDPLSEDWDWVRGHMQTLLRLTEEFSHEYSRLKREHASLDFHDLEQFALDLLMGQDRTATTPIALACRRKFKLVLVDEYQDINAAQDTILRAIARDGADANRFLVGDVKQSIYRFRLADPTIFQTYHERWRHSSGQGQVIPLSDNFRSAAPILDFVNALFSGLMRQEIGGVEYDSDARLRAGKSERPHGKDACVELHLRLTEKREPAEEEPEENATDTELEARMVARRLRELRESGHKIWDRQAIKKRAAEWRDMVVLLRSPAHRVDVYLKEFARTGVPLEAARGGLYDSSEVRDLLSLLQILDNPLQDVPLLAVLRSPLVAISLDELAWIRADHPDGLFWAALNRWYDLHRADKEAASTWAKIDLFLERFARWRKMGRHSALSERIECVLSETNYLDWLLTQSRPAQRQANVRRFIDLAAQFDPVQRQGLQQFLRYVEAQRDAETDSEPATVDNVDAVRLTSIHKSKGLEFPVTALAGLGTRFNLRDLSEKILLDAHYGLCAHVKPPGCGSSYPSLPWWLARQRQRREVIGEELRLLYVALTRACDTVLLFGTASRKTATEKWPQTAIDLLNIEKATSPLAWLGPWCAQQVGATWSSARQGASELFRWRFHGDEDLRASTPVGACKAEKPTIDSVKVAQLVRRLEWRYPFSAATRESAKLSVTALREANDDFEPRLAQRLLFRAARARTGLSAADIGTAHHLFLQMLELRDANDVAQLRAAATAMVQQQLLSPEQGESLDLKAIASFWSSKVGAKILSETNAVRREVGLTARFTAADLREVGMSTALPAGEFIVVQGTIDLAVIRANDIWIVDFKTDAITESDLPQLIASYAPQLRLYASAISRIYKRPVTKRWLHFLSLSRTVEV